MKDFLKFIAETFVWPACGVFGVLVALDWLSNVNKLLAIALGIAIAWAAGRRTLIVVLRIAAADVLFGHDAGLRSEIATALGIYGYKGDYSDGLRQKISEAIRSKEVQAAFYETIQDSVRMARD